MSTLSFRSLILIISLEKDSRTTTPSNSEIWFNEKQCDFQDVVWESLGLDTH